MFVLSVAENCPAKKLYEKNVILKYLQSCDYIHKEL